MNDRLRHLGLACAAALVFSGCAAVGGGLQAVSGLNVGGVNLSGLNSVGKNVSRAGETEDFTPEQKYYTGRTVAADLLTREKPSDKAALEAYVGKIGQTLALGCGLGDLPGGGWHFILIQGQEPEAYSCPGGIIFVSEGLVKFCENEDELAGALAHEIEHIALDHPIKAISAANRKAALAGLSSWGLSAAAQSQGVDGGNLANLTQAFDGVVKEVANSASHGYDRDKEAEADAAAVELLVETGYDPRGLEHLLSRLPMGDHSHGDPKARALAVEKVAYEAEPVPKTAPERSARFAAMLGR